MHAMMLEKGKIADEERVCCVAHMGNKFLYKNNVQTVTVDREGARGMAAYVTTVHSEAGHEGEQ